MKVLYTHINHSKPVEFPDSHDFRTAIVMYADRLGKTIMNTHNELNCQASIHDRVRSFIQYSSFSAMIGGSDVRYVGWKIHIKYVNIIGEEPGELTLNFTPSVDQQLTDASIRITKHINELIRNWE
jgi:hypothetical protein